MKPKNIVLSAFAQLLCIYNILSAENSAEFRKCATLKITSIKILIILIENIHFSFINIITFYKLFLKQSIYTAPCTARNPPLCIKLWRGAAYISGGKYVADNTARASFTTPWIWLMYDGHVAPPDKYTYIYNIYTHPHQKRTH